MACWSWRGCTSRSKTAGKARRVGRRHRNVHIDGFNRACLAQRSAIARAQNLLQRRNNLTLLVVGHLRVKRQKKRAAASLF